MNIIQMLNEIAFLNDRESSARFLDEQYMKAINSAANMILEDRLDNIKKPKKYSHRVLQTMLNFPRLTIGQELPMLN